MPKLVATGQRVGEDDRWWEEQVVEWRRTALQRVRGAADGWLKAIATITGLTSLLTIFKGLETLQGLSPGYRIAIGVLVASAFLGALVAIVLAALAAQGRLDATYATGYALRERERVEREQAVKRLKGSRIIACVALMPLLVAIGLSWYAPRATKRVLITRTDGSTLCYTPSAATPVTVDAATVAAVDSVSTCPKPAP